MQRYFAKELISNKLLLNESDIFHIKKVMRMKINDKIEVVLDEIVYLCLIENLDNFSIKIIDKTIINSEMKTEVIIAIGLVKEQKMDLILQKLTELGVKKIIPLNMERSIVKLDKERYDKKKKRWQTICKEASEQSFRNIIPEITDIMNLSDLIKEEADIKLVCSTNDKENKFNKFFSDDCKYNKILFVIGPEGGISIKEEDFLKNNNFQSITLGDRILRVETAAIYVASVISYIVG